MKSFASLVVMMVLGHGVLAADFGFQEHSLTLDGVRQPQLWGAELQYFRLRGGYGKNIPREKVIALWNKALDRMVEAKMNTVSFYIPWDFHEYADGKYDFTGTADEDKDGRADYPSRDLLTFFRLIEEHGIKTIMVRPGPYINAEWGFLGFGAIPKWFHDKFPDSHMLNASGFRTRLYDYHNPDFLKYSERWMKVLYEQVLHRYLGPGKPIAFLQIDNETNFMWQSVWNHDFGPHAISRYREFLKSRYGIIEKVNQAHGRSWSDFSVVQPSRSPGKNIAEDQDWYRFQDFSMFTYLQRVRSMWENLGVKEPTVMFTLAESYNAMKNGILPNYHDRNHPSTGMMTVNLYPKTYELPSKPLYNLPFKTDHDVKAAETATDSYLGREVEWVFGPEIQGGWWRGIDISEEARRQTYLTVLGHGMKALMVYYFHEGDNWGVEGLYEMIKPVYDRIKSHPKYVNASMQTLPPSFWNEFHQAVTSEIMDGLDTRGIMTKKFAQEKELFFDAPLDGSANPRDHFDGVREIGTKLMAPYGEFLGEAVAMTDPVCLIHEDAQHAPSSVANLDSLVINGEWMGGLVGYLLQTGINPKILHWGLNPEPQFDACKILLRHDNGVVNPKLVQKLQDLMARGSVVINFLDDSMSKALKLTVESKTGPARPERVSFLYDNTHALMSATPYFYYGKAIPETCRHNLYHNQDSVGYACQVGSGAFVQVGALFHGKLNSDDFALQNDIPQKRKFIEFFLRSQNIVPRVSVKEGGDRVSVFGRTDGKSQWITLKSGRKDSVKLKILVREVESQKQYEVKNLLTGAEERLSGQKLQSEGFAAQLGANDSIVYFVKESSSRSLVSNE